MKSIFQAMKEKKFSLQGLILPLLVYLTIIFLMFYVGSTNLNFLSVFILFLVVMPLTVVMIELVSIQETGAKLSDSPKFLWNVFRTTFRTRRYYYLFHLRSLLLLFLFVFGVSFSLLFGQMTYFVNYDPAGIQLFSDFQVLIATSPTTEQLMDFFTSSEASFVPYLNFFTIFLEYLLTISFVYVIYKGIFTVFIDLFIERRPLVNLREVELRFFSEPIQKRTIRRLMWGGFLLPLVLFTLVYAGAFSLFFYVVPFTNINQVFLRTNLIAIIPLIALLPFMIRYVFYVYYRVAETKNIEILEFTINEIKALIKTPGFPSENAKYFDPIINLKEQELRKLRGEKTGEETEVFPEEPVDKKV